MKTELKRYAWIVAALAVGLTIFYSRELFGPLMMMAIFLMCAAAAEPQTIKMLVFFRDARKAMIEKDEAVTIEREDEQ
jgi:hypothetical protein